MTPAERLAYDYAASEPLTFPEQSAPDVAATVEIEGKQVAIVRYATLDLSRDSHEPTFGWTATFHAIPADAKVHPLSRRFFLHDSEYHKAGEATGGQTTATVVGEAYAHCSTVQATIKAARERITRDRLYAQYAPIAEKNIGDHTRAAFDALDADADIEPGDLVVVYSHQKFRTGVAVKVTKTRVECLAATPTGRIANGATRTKGAEVRLLRKTGEPDANEQARRETYARLDAEREAAAPAEPRTPRGRWAAGLPPQLTPESAAGLRAAADDFRALGAAIETRAQAEPTPADDADGPVPAGPSAPAPELDEAEERRAVAGRVFASGYMDDAGAGSTLYRMVAARVGVRRLRIHDAGGELLGTVLEMPAGLSGETGWRAETPAGVALRAPGGLFGGFAEAVAAVRSAAAESDDQAATVAGQGGEGMAEAEAPAADRPPVEALLALVAARGIDPATLRAVADRIERDRAGHVTEIEVDGTGHFEWRCVQGDADQTGIEVGEDAYRAATAHGPLVADSPFVRGETIEHEGRGDNERGVPLRTLAGALEWQPYDGGEWKVAGWARTSDIDEGDIAGAQAWAARVIADSYGEGRPEVARWEHHRDRYGEWWTPVVR
ncbi:hypothetical protein ACIBTV_27585 [Micromonospora sp. NPDC049366]|uniref:hypothetical protein n=1 Tax=Micromonospora sp. NPDC049366 TaxID=3364271 RepID=UPI0037ACB7DF